MTKILFAIILSVTAFAQFQKPEINPQNQALCSEKLCDKIGRACNDAYALSKVSDACTRQLDLNCLDVSFSKLSRFDQDELNEVTEVAISCHYVDSNAIHSASAFLSKFEQDDLDEVVSLNSNLWLATNQCVSEAMSRVSKFNKDDLDEVKYFSQNCTGTFNSYCFNKLCPANSFSCDEADEVANALRNCVSGPSKQDRRRL